MTILPPLPLPSAPTRSASKNQVHSSIVDESPCICLLFSSDWDDGEDIEEPEDDEAAPSSTSSSSSFIREMMTADPVPPLPTAQTEGALDTEAEGQEENVDTEKDAEADQDAEGETHHTNTGDTGDSDDHSPAQDKAAEKEFTLQLEDDQTRTGSGAETEEDTHPASSSPTAPSKHTGPPGPQSTEEEEDLPHAPKRPPSPPIHKHRESTIPSQRQGLAQLLMKKSPNPVTFAGVVERERKKAAEARAAKDAEKKNKRKDRDQTLPEKNKRRTELSTTTGRQLLDSLAAAGRSPSPSDGDTDTDTEDEADPPLPVSDPHILDLYVKEKKASLSTAPELYSLPSKQERLAGDVKKNWRVASAHLDPRLKERLSTSGKAKAATAVTEEFTAVCKRSVPLSNLKVLKTSHPVDPKSNTDVGMALKAATTYTFSNSMSEVDSSSVDESPSPPSPLPPL